MHVPFCAGKCLYCDFFSVPRASVTAEKELAVARASVEQAAFLLEAMGMVPREGAAGMRPGQRLVGAGPWIETLYIGGGTPSVVSAETLGTLLAPFRSVPLKEWTVEANPESLDRRFIEACASAGVTRLSLGIQSMQDRALKLLGRPGSLGDNVRALELLAAGWTGEVSLDFIAGIPGQTAAEVRSDLSALSRVKARHASLYSLTLEAGTGLAAAVEEGSIELNDPEQDEDLWFTGKDELERRGFQNYEISNFRMPGKASLHNLRYWNLEPYLGVGPGAVSTLPRSLLRGVLERVGPKAAGSPSAVVRLTNPDSIDEYLAGPERVWGMRVEPVAPSEFLLENLMMGLRLAEGMPATRLGERFGRSFEDLFPGLWTAWVERGLAHPVDERQRLSEQGRLLLDSLLSEVAARLQEPRLPPLEVHWP